MRVKEMMKTELRTISPEDSAVLANEIMWRQRIHHLLVMEGSKLVGILSDTDLGGDNAEEIPDELLVRDAMSTGLITVNPEASVDQAIQLFDEHGINCLPVVDNNRPVGIITTTDIENLVKRGATERPQDPYVPLHRRGRGKSKHHHTQWPNP